MPIDLNSSIKNVSNKVFGNDILNGLFSNTISLSIGIAIFSILIILSVLPMKNKPLYKIFKVFLYIFLTSVVFVFFHDSVLKIKTKETEYNEDITTIGGMTNDIYGGSFKRVIPNTSNYSSRPNQSNQSNYSSQPNYSTVTGGYQPTNQPTNQPSHSVQQPNQPVQPNYPQLPNGNLFPPNISIGGDENIFS